MKPSTTVSTRARVRAIPAALAALLLPSGAVLGQDEEAPAFALSEVPSFGAARPGPVRPGTPSASPAAEDAAAEDAPVGVAPVQLQIDIPSYPVDAPIERGRIEDGVMLDPSGPWVITWYDALSALGEGTNVVMAGHVDYWTTGPAVLYGFTDPGVAEGDLIRVIAENEDVFEYSVDWERLYNVAEELTPEVIQNDIVGDTGTESLTIITCGGTFDPATGEYLERHVVRATLVS